MEQRLSAAEKQLAHHDVRLKDHDVRFNNANEASITHSQRITAIEAAHQARKEDEIKREAKDDARSEKVDGRLNQIDSRLDEMMDTLKWANRTIVGAVFLAIVAFVLKGGLFS